jgi:tetratricopeptide (TPR) repeat protein
MTYNDLCSFGELLRTFRTRTRLTQQQLARAIGLHRNAISHWEQGDFLPRGRSLVLELARQLHLDDQDTRELLEASLTALSPYWSVPLPRNPYFTGREEILEALHSQLGVDQAVALTQSSALHGLGGVGKTQIALEYAYQHALDYRAVFWIGAEKEEQIVASLIRIAEVLQLPEQDDKDQQRVVAAVQWWLNTHSGWLLICDNVEDLDVLPRFLPVAFRGAILITTRQAVLGTLTRGLNVLPMEQEEGILFLLRRAKEVESEAMQEYVQQFAVQRPDQYAAAAQLVRTMGGLPLALDQAGAYIEKTQCGLHAYLDLFHARQAALLRLRGDGPHDHPASVSTTYHLAMTATAQRHPAVEDFLRVCALLSADAIPEEFFVQGAGHLGEPLQVACADELEWNQLLSVVCSSSLVQRQPEVRMLSLHRLVQAVLCEEMDTQEHALWLRRVVAILMAAFPDVSHATWQQCERLLPHVLTVAAALPDQADDRHLGEVLFKAATYLCERAQYEQAESLYRRALRLLEYTDGPAHLAVASCCNGLAILSFLQGRYEQAESLHQRALRLWEQALGPTHITMAGPLYGLARLKVRQGHYVQAEPLYRRALSICEQTLGPEHPDVARPLDGLAILSLHLGKYEQAEQLYQRALQIREHTLGPEHPDVAHDLLGLGEVAAEQGRDEQAEQFYRQSLQIREQTLGPEHPEVTYILQDWAALLSRQRKYEQAESLYRRSLQIWEQALGTEHAEIAEPLNGLANLYRSQGKYAEAAPLYEQALHLREQHLGQTHPETAETLHGLALLLISQGKNSEARSLAERALTIRARSLGDTHPKTCASRTMLMQVGEEQGTHQQGASRSHCLEAYPDRVNTEISKEVTGLTPQEISNRSQIEDDPFQEFLTACCEVHPRAWCRSADLWRAYLCWTQEHQGRFPLSRRAFSAHLNSHGCQADRTNTARIWRGIALRSLTS